MYGPRYLRIKSHVSKKGDKAIAGDRCYTYPSNIGSKNLKNWLYVKVIVLWHYLIWIEPKDSSLTFHQTYRWPNALHQHQTQRFQIFFINFYKKKILSLPLSIYLSIYLSTRPHINTDHIVSSTKLPSTENEVLGQESMSAGRFFSLSATMHSTLVNNVKPLDIRLSHLLFSEALLNFLLTQNWYYFFFLIKTTTVFMRLLKHPTSSPLRWAPALNFLQPFFCAYKPNYNDEGF